MILERLTRRVQHNNKLNEFQSGFRKGYSTNENIFTLLNIVNIKMQRKRSKVYSFFVDFKAAFDSPVRHAIYCKLDTVGVSTKIIENIESYYSNTKAAV